MELETLFIPGLVAAATTAMVNLFFFIFTYGKLNQKVDLLADDVKEYKQKINTLEKDVSWLLGSFKAYEKINFIKTESPMKLTESGDTLLRESGGEEYITDHFDELYGEFDEIYNAYDIQKTARNIFLEKENSNDFDSMKEYLFQKGIQFSDLAQVMGIRLRDLVLDRKNILVGQVNDSTRK